MNQKTIGLGMLAVGLAMAMLNKSLAQTGREMRIRIHRPALSLGAARAFIVVGGLIFASLGLLVMLSVFTSWQETN